MNLGLLFVVTIFVFSASLCQLEACKRKTQSCYKDLDCCGSALVCEKRGDPRSMFGTCRSRPYDPSKYESKKGLLYQMMNPDIYEDEERRKKGFLYNMV